MKKNLKKALVGTVFGATLAFAPASFAQDATPLDDLEVEMAKMEDVYDNITPVAIGAAAFSVGMIIIKRVAFS